MRPVIIVGLVIAAGCGDKAVELRLRLPTGASADVDLSCVAAVRVYAWGQDVAAEPPNQCIALSAPVHTFTQLQAAISGRLDLDLPDSGLAGMDVAGMTTSDCLAGDAIFYGGATYDHGDSLTVPLHVSLDCSQRATFAVRPIDYVALAGGVCAAAPTVKIDRGSIHPTLLDLPMPTMVFDYSAPSANVVGGVASIPDALVAIGDDSCLAIGDPGSQSVGCVRPGARGACSTGNELELTTIDLGFADRSVDAAASTRYSQIVFGSVWDSISIPKHPVSGASLTLGADVAGHAQIDVATYTAGATALAARAGTTTDAGGLFIVYMDHPVTVTISAPGYKTKQVRFTAADYIYGALTIALEPS